MRIASSAKVTVSRLPARPPVAQAAVVACAALALTTAGCGSTAGPRPARTAPLISIFEAPAQLTSAPGPTLDQLRALGVDYVRVNVYWRLIAPDPGARRPPAGFDAASPAAYPPSAWAPYDAIVRDATARGIGVYLTLTGPAPDWATGPGWPGRRRARGVDEGVWKPSAADFGAFVRAVATRYSGRYTPPGASAPLPRVGFWSLWNEPNLGEANLAPQAIDGSTVEASPAMYRALLDAGWSALQATGHGHDTVLIGELAPYGRTGDDNPGNFGYMVPLRFVRALYCLDGSLRPLRGAAARVRGCPATAAASSRFARQNPALFQASGFAVHPYLLQAVAPDTVFRSEPGFANLAALPRLERVLRAATAVYGRARAFALYDTEFGYITDPPLAGWAPLSLAAAYENWAEYISWRNPLIRSWDHYLLADPPPSGPSHFFSGLEFYDGVPKPTYAAFRMPIFLPVTSAPRGRPLEVWGCVRPARYAALQTHRTQRVQIQLRPAGASAFEVLRSVPIRSPYGYFDIELRFPSSGAVRLAWAYPHGPTIHSRVVEVTLR